MPDLSADADALIDMLSQGYTIKTNRLTGVTTLHRRVIERVLLGELRRSGMVERGPNEKEGPSYKLSEAGLAHARTRVPAPAREALPDPTPEPLPEPAREDPPKKRVRRRRKRSADDE